jgi:hypothetical protein
LNAAADQAIAACGGDAREAVKALIVANEFLEAELETQVSLGYIRGVRHGRFKTYTGWPKVGEHDTRRFEESWRIIENWDAIGLGCIVRWHLLGGLMNPWSVVQYVGSGLSLVAFVVAAALFAYRAKLNQRADIIKNAPPKDRLKVVEATADLIKLNLAGLSPEQKFEIISSRQWRQQVLSLHFNSSVS